MALIAARSMDGKRWMVIDMVGEKSYSTMALFFASSTHP
jgi:hypothetical protein